MFCNVIIHNADKENGPKSINDLKLINAGKILENNRTLMESRLPLTEVPGGVITMHVVVRPLHLDKNTGNPQKNTFQCIIYILHIRDDFR